MPKDIEFNEDATIKPAQLTVQGIVVGQIDSVLGNIVYVRSPVSLGAMPQQAMSMVPPDTLSVGQSVGLMFAEGDVTRPTIIGPMHTDAPVPSTLVVQSDNESITLEHDREISLRCGKAKLTLTADGRVDISGDYVISTARTTNRIAGASVKIN